jgi:HlyD family secretion protein
MKRPAWKHTRTAAVVLVVAAIAAVALWPAALEVDVARVERGPMQVTIDEEGETRVVERFVVSAPVAGRLQRIELEPGDRVVRGTSIVARLVPVAAPLLDSRTRTELSAAVAAAGAAVDQARAERGRAAAVLERAQSSARREQRLADAGAIPLESLEGAQTALKTAEAAFKAADSAVARSEQELRLARARLQSPSGGGRAVEIVAPVDGVILKRLRESESVVPSGEPLLEIGDPRRLEVVADLLSTDAVRVSAGDPVFIEEWGGGQPLHARVRRVEPSGFMKVSALGVEEQRVNVVIEFVDAETAARALGDAYRVEVRVVVWRGDDVVKVPVGALFRSSPRTDGASGAGPANRAGGWAVFVVEHDRARLQPVELGRRNSEAGQIVKGLEPGQLVVLHPPDAIADGTRVTVRRQ